jgi:hypothetical protein
MGHQVPPDLDHEVSVPDIARESGGASPRCDSADMPGAGSDDRAWVGVARSHPSAGVGAAVVVTGKAGAVREREVKRQLQEDFPHLRKRYWGQHMWAWGYFCVTVGVVDEKMIMEYIENQKWEEDAESFKITESTKP